MHKLLFCVCASAGMHVLSLTISAFSSFHACYSLSGYELNSVCLICCTAAKWDYGREQQSMRCLSCRCQDRTAQQSNTAQCRGVVLVRSEYVQLQRWFRAVNLRRWSDLLEVFDILKL